MPPTRLGCAQHRLDRIAAAPVDDRQLGQCVPAGPREAGRCRAMAHPGATPDPAGEFAIGQPRVQRPRPPRRRAAPADDQVHARIQQCRQPDRIGRIERRVAVAERHEIGLRGQQPRVTGRAIASLVARHDLRAQAAGDRRRSRPSSRYRRRSRARSAESATAPTAGQRPRSGRAERCRSPVS